MRALLLMLLLSLAGCAYFETQPAAQPNAASRAAILEWALWAPRPRAQYAVPPVSSEPVLVHQSQRNGFSYRSGGTAIFTRY